MPIPGISCMGVAGGSGGGFSLAYLSTASSASATSHTFSSVSFGNPSADRIIIVGVQQSNSNLAPSLTIGGVSATQIITKFSGSTRASIYAALVPTGETGNIVVTASTSMAIRIGWYRMTRPSGSVTATNSAFAIVSTGNVSLFCTVPPNGAGVVMVADNTTGSHTGTNYTEYFDGADGAGVDSGTGGIFTTSATLTCQNTTNNTTDKSLVYASWGP